MLTDDSTTTAPRRDGRRRWPWAAIAVVVAIGAFVLYWFQPHKLFIDDKVNEAVPTVGRVVEGDGGPTDGDAAATSTSMTPAPDEPTVIATGSFTSLDHGTSGTVRVLALADGTRFVRIEGLDTDNGPDLFVYLSTNPVDGEEGAFDEDFVNVGRLKGNQGDQNYELAEDIDLGRYLTVVIWCDRFDSAFGAAGLTRA